MKCTRCSREWPYDSVHTVSIERNGECVACDVNHCTKPVMEESEQRYYESWALTWNAVVTACNSMGDYCSAITEPAG